MNAADLTFGIEIETIAPTSAVQEHGLRIGAYKHGIQVPYLPAGWTASDDGSIRTNGRGLPCEIVSPILKGAEGIAQVIEVINALNAYGHRVNESCGTHVHVGWKRSWSSISLARLITIVAYLENGLYAITGTKSRERGANGTCYTKGLRRYGNDKTAKVTLDRDRYHTLNLTNLASGTKETVEFRAFGGSLNATKVCGWIQVCLGLVERALNGKRSPKWDPKPLKGGWAKAGLGQSETERLMGFLAWGEGYAKQHGGNSYGWVSDAVDHDAIKAEFRRLAKKYDAMA